MGKQFEAGDNVTFLKSHFASGRTSLAFSSPARVLKQDEDRIG
jgi:hypothetical protein